LCPAYRFRSGGTVSASHLEQSMQDAQRWISERQVWLNRGDIGVGHEAITRWHEQPERTKFLFKLKFTSGARHTLHAPPESARECAASEGVWADRRRPAGAAWLER
jgi:hypothetical protein